MSLFVLMAVRPIEEGKSRLAAKLTLDERKSLNLNMFRHVFEVVRQVVPPDRVIVISRSAALLEEIRTAGAHPVKEAAIGLNPALAQSSQVAADRGATALLSISSDLPFLEADDIGALLGAGADVVIATDVARNGTNALLVRRPFAIPFRYGEGSLAAHRAAAAEAGLTVEVVERPGLARDIDTPSDLQQLRHG